MSIMKKMFNFSNNLKTRKPHSSQSRFQPHLEPLEDRHLLAVASLLQNGAVASDFSANEGYAEMTLKIGSATGNAPVVGIRIDATSASFDPAAVAIYNSQGTKITSDKIFYSNNDFQGKSGLLIAQLAPGEYTLRVTGDRATYGAFTCDVFLPGDVNGDHIVSDKE